MCLFRISVHFLLGCLFLAIELYELFVYFGNKHFMDASFWYFILVCRLSFCIVFGFIAQLYIWSQLFIFAFISTKFVFYYCITNYNKIITLKQQKYITCYSQTPHHGTPWTSGTVFNESWNLNSKVKVKMKLVNHVWLSVTPWTIACQDPPSLGFSRQEYWSGLPFPSGDLPDLGIEAGSPRMSN